MTYAIECRQLTKTWPGKPPVEAVRGIDLQVEQGTCFNRGASINRCPINNFDGCILE